jgi:membrane protease YdiL (CAAX protease family)
VTFLAQEKTDYIIMVGVAILTLWAATQFSQLSGQTETAGISQVYATMAILSIVGFFAASRGLAWFGSFGIKESGLKLAMLVAAGAFVGYFSTSQGKLLLVPLLPAAIDVSLSFAYKNIIAVFGEEYFFRGFLQPSIAKIVAGKSGNMLASIIAIVAQAGLFVAWHFVAYQNAPDSFMPLFIFGLIQGTMVRVTGSIAPALGAHFVLNLINK